MMIAFFILFINARKYLNEAPVSTPEAIPISVGIAQMTIDGTLTCNNGNPTVTTNNVGSYDWNINNNNTPEGARCGLVCNTSGTFEYTFKGVQFAIYGTISPGFGSFNIYIDEVLDGSVSETGSSRQEHVVLYTSNILEYKDHKVKISSSEGTYEMYKIVYWPSVKARRVNITDFTITGGNWDS